MIRTDIHDMMSNVYMHRIILCAVYILLTFLLFKIINIILTKIEKKFEQTEHTSKVALVLTIKEPLHVLIWSMCLYKILILSNINLGFIFDLRIILVSGVIIWLLFRFINQYTRLYIDDKQRKKQDVDYDGINFVKKISQIFSVFVTVVFCLGKLGISVQSLVTISGAGSLIIGLAAKDTLSNIFGGLMIYLDKPFAVGDWIDSPDRKIEGFVEEIGWRRTRILTFPKYPIYVANSIFTDIIIENKTRMKSRRISEIIPIRYVDVSKLNKIVKDISDMLYNHININHRLNRYVSFDSIGSGAILNLRLNAFANTIELLRYIEIKQDVLIKTIEIIQNNGGELAYGVQEIVLKKEKKPVVIHTEDSVENIDINMNA